MDLPVELRFYSKWSGLPVTFQVVLLPPQSAFLSFMLLPQSSEKNSMILLLISTIFSYFKHH